MLATRVEMQVAADWMAVPVARNLHWRYAVLQSALMSCKLAVPIGVTGRQNLEKLVEATKKIWSRMVSNSVVVQKHKRLINGNLGLIFSADDVTLEEKIILRSYLNTTSCIAGCQAIRSKIGHCLFGFRVVHGESIFVTVSPNRRHSSLILNLSRCRHTDTS